MNRYAHPARLIMAITLLTVIGGCTLSPAAETPNPLAQTQAILLQTSVAATETPSATPTETLSLAVQVTETPSPTFTPSPTNTPLPTITVCAPRSGWPAYIVQPGENLFRIALRYNLTAEDLRIANCLPAAETIFAGQTIYVPYYIPPTPVPPPAGSSTQAQGPNVLDEISFDPGGENEVPVCADPALDGTRQITSSDRLKDMYELCVYGFPSGEQVTVELYAPDGHFVASGTYPVSQQAAGPTIIRVPLWAPVGVPLGTWSARARSATGQITKSFSIGPFSQPTINTVPSGEINPLENRKCAVYSSGQTVVINGTNFASGQTLPVAIYVWTPNVQLDSLGRYILPLLGVHRVGVTQGGFSIQVTVQEADVAGVYWVLAISDSTEQVYKRIDTRNDCYQVQ